MRSKNMTSLLLDMIQEILFEKEEFKECREVHVAQSLASTLLAKVNQKGSLPKSINSNNA
jgi:hypothetical protein